LAQAIYTQGPITIRASSEIIPPYHPHSFLLHAHYQACFATKVVPVRISTKVVAVISGKHSR